MRSKYHRRYVVDPTTSSLSFSFSLHYYIHSSKHHVVLILQVHLVPRTIQQQLLFLRRSSSMGSSVSLSPQEERSKVAFLFTQARPRGRGRPLLFWDLRCVTDADTSVGSHPMFTPWHCTTKNELQELQNGMLVYVPHPSGLSHEQ